MTASTVAGGPVLAPPPGELLAKVATISDLHIGEPGFGLRHGVREPRGTSPAYAVRCAAAAVREAIEWGASLIVVKGDLTWSSRVLQWERTATVLAASSVPVVVTLGNHDTSTHGVDGRPLLEAAGLAVVGDADAMHVDMPGLRLIALHTPGVGDESGSIGAALRSKAFALAAEGRADGRGVLVAMHHYPDRFPQATRYPHGIAFEQADPFLAGLPAGTLVTCGHTHRNRRYVRHGVTVTEVGSTKDFPGTWAGYAVHEGGIRQVVRRIADPDVLAWTDRTAAVLGGLYGWWTPGLLRWRCFSMAWPDKNAFWRQ